MRIFGRSESVTLNRQSTKPISTSFRFKSKLGTFFVLVLFILYFDDCELKGSKGDLLIDTGVGIHEVFAILLFASQDAQEVM